MNLCRGDAERRGGKRRSGGCECRFQSLGGLREMDIWFIASLAVCAVGGVGFIGFLIWLVIRIVGWDSKWPAILGLVFSLAVLCGGVFLTFQARPDLRIPLLSDFLQRADAPRDSEETGSEKGLFKVTVTIPPYFLEGDVTQEQLDQAVREEKRFQSAVLNGDGSVTYEMNRLQHWKQIRELKERIGQELSDIAGSEEFPSLAGVKVNRNFTEYTVTVSGEETGLPESVSVLGFYMLSGMYRAYSGGEPENVCVKFVSEATGEVLEEFNSLDLAKGAPAA